MQIKFWGVRGSIPCPGPDTMKYGGNTPCIELRFIDSERLIIIDAGSGIRELGNALMSRHSSGKPIRAELFITHTHWDHIQGFPFFTPIYRENSSIKVYGPFIHQDTSLEDTMAGQLSYRYFPVRIAELVSDIEYIELKEGSLDLGDGLTLITKYLNHPLLCLGYRFEYKGKAFCTAYDTEPYRNIFSAAPDDPSFDEAAAEGGRLAAIEGNRQMIDFFSGADLLVHDTQYTQEEYESHKTGWGHSSFEHAIAGSQTAGVKRLALFHHEPVRNDRQIDYLTRKYCQPRNNGNMEVFFAREGMQIEI